MRFMKSRGWWCRAAVALSVGVPLMVFGKSEALAVGTPAETFAAPWHLSRAHATSKYRIWVVLTSGYCYGAGKPHIAHVKVVERGAPGGRRRGRAVITVFEHDPPIRNAEGECAGIGLTLEKSVRLRRPVARLSLYDGSSQPARLVVRRHAS
jgi:hypothetical protein